MQPWEQDGLQVLHDFLSSELAFTSVQLATLLASSPDWLVQKLQLFPSERLPSKLSCLMYQLSELCSGHALDIEDHYLSLGVPKADLTYKRGSHYHFVDVTTSSSESLRALKLSQLQESVAHLPGATSAVVTVPVLHSVDLDAYLHPPADDWEQFNRLLIRSDPLLQSAFDEAMVETVVPSIKRALWDQGNRMARTRVSSELTGELKYTADEHPTNWLAEDPRLLEQLKHTLPIALAKPTKHPYMVPLPGTKLRMPTFEEAWRSEDPVTAGMLLACLVPSELRGAGLRIPYKSLPSEWEVFCEAGRAAEAEFRYHGAGAVRAQRAALDDPEDKVLYLLVDTDDFICPDGLRLPRHFSVACGRQWTGYSAELLTRGFREDTGQEYESSGLSGVTLQSLQAAQSIHDEMVSVLASETGGLQASLAKKVMAAATATKGVEWAGLLSGALRRKGEDTPIMLFNTYLFKQLSAQYDLARTVSIVLSAKHSLYRFRIAVSGPSHLLVAVGCGNAISRMRDCPVSMWTPQVASHASFRRARCRTVSVSSRLLAWWLRLPFVAICRASQAVQHNLPLPPGHRLSDSLTSVVEHINMHLTTRQQDSLLQDQTRYVLAGLMSPDPDQVGPLSKAKGVWVKSASHVVYWGRLCRLQAISFLTKQGMRPALAMSPDSPPLVVPPQHSTPLSTFPSYIDAMFDSKIFNKDKDHKTDAQALDWLGILENEVKYRNARRADDLLLFGGSYDLKDLVGRCIEAGSILPVLADLASDRSVWVDSATTWWDHKLAGRTSLDFSWNSAACYAIFAAESRGCRLSARMADYTGVLPDLGQQSLTTFMSSSGSTAKGPPVDGRQSVRKSTALLGFVADHEFNEDIPYQEVGVGWMRLATSKVGQHQSLFLASLWQLQDRGASPLVARHETKEQSAGGREFSAMNAIGIVSCRAAERVFAMLLPEVQTDRMTDPDAERTLHEQVKGHSDERTLFAAADNSRFGPSQVMAKSRCLATCLCLNTGRPPGDKVALSHVYEVLSEPTRRMQTKYSKMPFELFCFVREFGGWAKVAAHKPESTFGKLAAVARAQLGMDTLEPGIVQEWGMYQGALGMFSSCASSFLHDFLCEVLVENRLCARAIALVTNDDSLLRAIAVPEDTPLKEASYLMKCLLACCLGYGGQVLNMFKTVFSTIVGEFHSTFATRAGLVCPELKVLVAGLQFGRGERISDDALAPVEEAIAALRAGCSLYSATTLAICLTVAHCDQYNRWKAFKKHGTRPAELGGPVELDLVKECLIPGYASLSWYASSFQLHHEDRISAVLASSFTASEASTLLQLEQAGIMMTTRRIHRQARGNNEVSWSKPLTALPLSGRTALGPLASTVSSGLLRGTAEQGQDRLLVRFGRNQVSPTYLNLSLGAGHWAKHRLSGEKISYDQLDNITREDLEQIMASDPVPPASKLVANARFGLQKVLRAVKVAHAAPATLPLLLRGSTPTVRSFAVAPVRVRPSDAAYVPPNLENGIRVWGSDLLQTRLQREMHGRYDPSTYHSVEQEVKDILATTVVFNKLVKSRSGPFKIVEPPSHHLSAGQLAAALCSRVYRGLRTVNTSLSSIVGGILEVSRGGLDLPESPEVLTYSDLLVGLQVQRAYTRKAVGVPNGDLRALWGQAPSGWFHDGIDRVKLKHLGRRVRVGGRFAWEAYALVTRISSAGRYNHVLLGVSTAVDFTAVEGVPDFIAPLLKGVVRPGDVRRGAEGETIRVLGPSEQTTVLLDARSWGLMAVTPAYTVGLRRSCPPPLLDEKVQWNGRMPTAADGLVVMSGGTVKVGSRRWRQAAGDPLTQELLDELGQEFGTRQLALEVASANLFRRPDVSNEWLSAAEAVAGLSLLDHEGESTWEYDPPDQSLADVVSAVEEDGEAQLPPDYDPDRGYEQMTAEEADALYWERNRQLMEEIAAYNRAADEEADRAYEGDNPALAQYMQEGLDLLANMEFEDD